MKNGLHRCVRYVYNQIQGYARGRMREGYSDQRVMLCSCLAFTGCITTRSLMQLFKTADVLVRVLKVTKHCSSHSLVNSSNLPELC